MRYPLVTWAPNLICGMFLGPGRHGIELPAANPGSHLTLSNTRPANLNLASVHPGLLTYHVPQRR